MSQIIVDLTGEIYEGMWHYPDPYFGPEVRHIDPPDWLTPAVYSEAVRMPLQTGTYVESSAHCFEDDPGISEYPLDRTVMLPTVCVGVPKRPGEAVTAEELSSTVDALCPDGAEGMGLLIGTGWDSHWRDEDFVTDCPFFDDSVIDFVIERGFSLLGGDSPRFEDPKNPSGHLRRLLGARKLLLAPLCNLGQIAGNRGFLIAPPLNIPGVCATPTRALFMMDRNGE